MFLTKTISSQQFLLKAIYNKMNFEIGNMKKNQIFNSDKKHVNIITRVM